VVTSSRAVKVFDVESKRMSSADCIGFSFVLAPPFFFWDFTILLRSITSGLSMLAVASRIALLVSLVNPPELDACGIIREELCPSSPSDMAAE